MEIASGAIVGLEALLRWPHPERGFVSPKEFVPVAEELGLIHELGAWVLDTVVAQMMVWRERGIAPQDVAINVSPYQLHDRSSFVGPRRVRARTDGSCRPSASCSRSPSPRRSCRTRRCRRASRRCASSASRSRSTTSARATRISGNLTRFAFKKLKIDRSLLPQSHDERSRKLFANVVAMARELGLTVVAEGVETPNELATVAEARCAVVQGYFYSPPVSPEKLDALADRALPEPGASIVVVQGTERVPHVIGEREPALLERLPDADSRRRRTGKARR